FDRGDEPSGPSATAEDGRSAPATARPRASSYPLHHSHSRSGHATPLGQPEAPSSPLTGMTPPAADSGDTPAGVPQRTPHQLASLSSLMVGHWLSDGAGNYLPGVLPAVLIA